MILIVDDISENIFSLKKLLQLHSYDVDTAMSGEEALKKVLKNDYELIILDVQMPGMDGYEVAETITGYSKTRNIPIIFLSAVNIDKRFITKGYSSGGVEYVTKPFDPDLLMLKVKTFSRLHAQTIELKRIQESLKAEIEIKKGVQKQLENANVQLEEKVKERTFDLLQSNKKLEESNIDLQQFASIASHDLQEPLRKIMIFSQLVNERFFENEPEAGKYMEKIFSSSNRMRNLINDLLEYSKLSRHATFQQTDLNCLVQETVNDLELAIQDKQAQLVIDELPVVEAIPGQIRQVFQNLISNALKFASPHRTPVINISCRQTDWMPFSDFDPDVSNHVRIDIADNGIGFDEIYLDKIFTIFQRLHDKDQYEGNGIGLAIVKKIIEKHNGGMSAASKEGEGSVFSIVLPVKQAVSVSEVTAVK